MDRQTNDTIWTNPIIGMKIQTNTQELGTWNQLNTGTEYKEQGTQNSRKPSFHQTTRESIVQVTYVISHGIPWLKWVTVMCDTYRPYESGSFIHGISHDNEETLMYRVVVVERLITGLSIYLYIYLYDTHSVRENGCFLHFDIVYLFADGLSLISSSRWLQVHCTLFVFLALCYFVTCRTFVLCHRTSGRYSEGERISCLPETKFPKFGPIFGLVQCPVFGNLVLRTGPTHRLPSRFFNRTEPRYTASGVPNEVQLYVRHFSRVFGCACPTYWVSLL